MSDTLTKRERLVAAQKTRFESILVANGYRTNIGRSVHIWRTGTFSPDELVDGALVVRDLSEIKEVDGEPKKLVRSGTEKFSRDLQMQLQVLTNGEDAIEKIRATLADIERAIRVDVRWGRLALGTRPRIDRAIVEQDSNKVGGVLYEYFINFVTDAFDAYH